MARLHPSPVPSPNKFKLPLCGLVAVMALLADGAAQTTGELFYTRYRSSSSDPFRVKKVQFTYTGTQLTLGPRVGVARNIGADGLVFSPRGTLLVAGQGNRRICEVQPTTGAVIGCSGLTSTSVFHVTMDPSATKIWTSEQPGNRLFEIPLQPGPGRPVERRLRNGQQLTQVVFTPHGVFYTRSNPTGANSAFGSLDLSTNTATPQITGVSGIHGATFDRHTGHVVAFGSRFITQIDVRPTTPRVVGRLDVRTLPTGTRITAPIDQGTSNGRGLLFAAVNGSAPGGGYLIMLDITQSKAVTRPDFSAITALDTFLDDVAPLSGAGCSAPAIAANYGAGWAGTSGIPAITSTKPLVRQMANLTIGSAASQSTAACLLVGTRSANVSTPYGGRLLVEANLAEIPFALAPAGSSVPYYVPLSACGTNYYLQLVHLDRGASRGVAFSRGLRIAFGN